MTGLDIYNILSARGVTYLHHANSVKTSLSQLTLGGLASRQLVELNRLPQTDQYTDNQDRHYGIWGDVFMDTVDIHERASNRNQYGPVLFVVRVEILQSLPVTSRILITRLNPSKWHQIASDAQRYFLTEAELRVGLRIGDFDQMLIIRTEQGIVPFMQYLQAIYLDEPRFAVGSGVSAEFTAAANALIGKALATGIHAPVIQRPCNHCKCFASYASSSTHIPRFYSLP